MRLTGERRSGGDPRRASGIARYAPFCLILVGLLAGYAFGLHQYLSLQSLLARHQDLKTFTAAHPVLAFGGFFLVYVLAVAFSFPAASVLTIFAGFLFGWFGGWVVVSVAATTGAALLFLSARNACSGLIEARAGPWLQRFSAGFRRDAFHYLLILRLAPICPFFLVNIAPAFFKVPLRTYLVATFIGILPGTFVFAWLGGGLESAVAAADASGRALTFADFMTTRITLAFVGLALVAALPLIVRHRCGKAGCGAGEKV